MSKQKRQQNTRMRQQYLRRYAGAGGGRPAARRAPARGPAARAGRSAAPCLASASAPASDWPAAHLQHASRLCARLIAVFTPLLSAKGLAAFRTKYKVFFID